MPEVSSTPAIRTIDSARRPMAADRGIKTKPSRPDRKIQHQLHHGRIANEIGLRLVRDYEGGKFSFTNEYEFVVAMEAAGVINPGIIRQRTMRMATISNVIEEKLLGNGRMIDGRDLPGKERGRFYVLTPDEYSIRCKELKQRLSEREERQEVRRQQRDAARANGQPTPLSRKERRRQNARNAERDSQKGRRSSKGRPHRRVA